MNYLSKSNINALMRPCRNRHWGGYYALILLAVAAVYVCAVVLINIISFTVNTLTKLSIKAYNSYKRAEHERQAKLNLLNRFRKFSKDIFISDNTIYYTVRSHKKTEEHLTMYVDFYTRNVHGGFVSASEELQFYLSQNASYELGRYKGRSEKLAGAKVLVDMEQLQVESALKKVYGSEVSLKYIDKDLVNI